MKLRTLKPRLKAVDTSRARPAATTSWRAGKESSAQRGYGYKWQQARAGHLAAHPFCVYCLRDAGITAIDPAAIFMECIRLRVAPFPYATIVDHSVPHRGDMTIFWDKSKWQSLCATHHSRDKQREEARTT